VERKIDSTLLSFSVYQIISVLYYPKKRIDPLFFTISLRQGLEVTVCRLMQLQLAWSGGLYTALIGLVIVVALLALLPTRRPRRAREAVVTENTSSPVAGAVQSLPKRVTINALGTLLKETSPNSLSTDGATLIPEAVHALVSLLQSCHQLQVFVIVQVTDDIGECAVKGALEDGEISSAIQAHRILFCSTMEGVVAIVRQLEPDVHIDACISTAEELSRFIQNVVLIQTKGIDLVKESRMDIEENLSKALTKL
jgi:hypothetical protein